MTATTFETHAEVDARFRRRPLMCFRVDDVDAVVDDPCTELVWLGGDLSAPRRIDLLRPQQMPEGLTEVITLRRGAHQTCPHVWTIFSEAEKAPFATLPNEHGNVSYVEAYYSATENAWRVLRSSLGVIIRAGHTRTMKEGPQ